MLPGWWIALLSTHSLIPLLSNQLPKPSTCHHHCHCFQDPKSPKPTAETSPFLVLGLVVVLGCGFAGCIRDGWVWSMGRGFGLWVSFGFGPWVWSCVDLVRGFVVIDLEWSGVWVHGLRCWSKSILLIMVVVGLG